MFKAFDLVDMFAMDESCTEGKDTGDTTPQSYDGSVLATTAPQTSQEGSTRYQDTLPTTQAPAFQAGPVIPTTKTVSASAGARTSSKLQVRYVSHAVITASLSCNLLEYLSLKSLLRQYGNGAKPNLMVSCF